MAAKKHVHETFIQLFLHFCPPRPAPYNEFLHVTLALKGEKEIMWNRRLVIACLLLNAYALPPAWSQESRASVLGRITDSSGSVVPEARVEFTNLSTGVIAKTETN